MTLRKPVPPLPIWAFALLIFIAILIILSTQGCATCEPTIIKVPVEVEVPVPIPPEPLEIAPAPEMEVCGEILSITDRVKCIRRNIERWRIYARKLLDEIEAHNAAIPE